MARRWQLSLWVLAGLALSVVALWDSATVSAVADRVTERTETVDGSDRRDTDGQAPSDLAFSDLGGPGSVDGGSNLLRPTTTTTRPTTTTTSTVAPPEEPVGGETDIDGAGADREKAPGSATTTPVDGEGDPKDTTDGGGSSSTTQHGLSTVAADPAMTTVYDEDFADGELSDGRWSIASSAGNDGWGLLRPSSVSVLPDSSAAGGHVLAITARMGTGAEAGLVVSGAVRLVDHQLSSGRYTVRARVDVDHDRATAGVVLLRPASSDDAAETANEEIRIVDTSRNRTTRTPVESTVQWTGADGAASTRKAHRTADGPVSAAAWHVYTLDWTADRVTVAVDGDPLNLTVDPARIPQGPMDLVIRLDPLDSPTAPGEQPVLSSDVRLLIDWIRIERVNAESS